MGLQSHMGRQLAQLLPRQIKQMHDNTEDSAAHREAVEQQENCGQALRKHMHMST